MTPSFNASHPSDDAPELSRAETLAAIDASSDFPTLFHIANEALGRGRRQWGDDPQTSSCAAMLWRSCSFPVAAGPIVAISHAKHIAGARLLELGFQTAKAAARTLLAPMPDPWKPPPAESSGEPSTPRPSIQAPSPFDDFYATIQSFTDILACELAPCANTSAPAFFTSGPHTYGAARRYLCGSIPSPRDLADYALRGDASWTRNQWTLIEQQTTLCREGLSAKSPTPPLGDFHSAMEHARSVGGFRYLSAGPSGGAPALFDIARELDRSCRELAALLGQTDARVASLGHLGVALNIDRDFGDGRDPYASFNQDRSLLSFYETSVKHFAHEWTHALEHFCDINKKHPAFKKPRSELYFLKEAISKTPPDPDAARQHLDELRDGWPTTETVAYFLTDKGLRRLGASEALAEAAPIARAIEQIVDLHENPSDAEPAVLELLEAHRDPERDPINTEGLRVLVSTCSEYAKMVHRFSREYQLGTNVFNVRAFQANCHNSHGDGAGFLGTYWTDKGELIARVAESYFHHLGASTALAASIGLRASGYWPQGSELSAMGSAYQRWIVSCMPAINEAILQRLGAPARADIPSDPAPARRGKGL